MHDRLSKPLTTTDEISDVAMGVYLFSEPGLEHELRTIRGRYPTAPDRDVAVLHENTLVWIRHTLESMRHRIHIEGVAELGEKATIGEVVRQACDIIERGKHNFEQVLQARYPRRSLPNDPLEAVLPVVREWTVDGTRTGVQFGHLLNQLSAAGWEIYDISFASSSSLMYQVVAWRPKHEEQAC